MKCQSLFSEEKKKKYFKISCAENFTQHAISTEWFFCKSLKYLPSTYRVYPPTSRPNEKAALKFHLKKCFN